MIEAKKGVVVRIACALCLLAVGFCLLGGSPAEAQDGGEFEGTVIVEWLDDPVGPDRDMKVLREFGFRDGRGERWVVPEGAVINGASIPRFLWREAGSPFVGDYRKASVIHDHYCTTKERSWKATHRVFYDAMIAAGMPELQAKIYYGAVYGGGPRWVRIAGVAPGGPEVRVRQPEFTEQDFEALEELVRREDPSLAALEAQVDRMVRP